MAAKPRVTLQNLAGQLSQGLTSIANKPNIWGYVPHEKQIAFHSAPAPTRLMLGGNRSGKTVGGCVEDIWWLTGNHPYRKTPPPPVRGRIIGVDFDNGVEKILKPEIARWIPPSALINGSWEDSYEKGLRTLRLANGSFLEFMSYIQEVEKFAGTSRHFVHYDEEPPQSIYGENKLRLLDTGGSDWFTMTPVQGMTWIYDEIYIPGITGENQWINVVQVDVTENPNISVDEIDRILSGLSEDEKKARKSGIFVQMGGLVFKDFGERHIIDPIDMKQIMDWRWIASMDHGFNNPTVWLWHAISPEGKVVTFHEHYMAEWTVEQHAAEVKRINKEFGKSPELYVGDPAIKQRNAATGHSIQIEYIKHGIPIALARNDVRSGVDRVNNYIRHPGDFYRITDNCYNLIREMRRLRWKTHSSVKLRFSTNPFEEIHKKDDHAPDAERYFFTFMPELEYEVGESELVLNERQMRAANRVGHLLNARTPVNTVAGFRDPVFVGQTDEATDWTVIDDTVGGIW